MAQNRAATVTVSSHVGAKRLGEAHFPMTFPKSPAPWLAALAFLTVWPASARPPEAISDYRSKMEKWVETRQILSGERADWEVEQETLRASRDLLRQEKKALEEEIAKLSASNTAADDERRELLLTRGELQRSRQALETRVQALEKQVLELAPQLPEPLQKKLEPLFVQIPEDPENTRLPIGQRLVNVLGVLAQADKFNRTATFVGETRAVPGAGGDPDAKVSVRTLYWGLGQALYVDSQGHSAGIGQPGPTGWVFSNDPAIASEVGHLIDIYEGNVDAIEFVSLPVQVR